MLIIILTGCGNKRALTKEEFVEKTQSKGYTVTDLTSSYSNYNHINYVVIAVDPKKQYQLEFYGLIDKENAISVFNQNKTIFEGSKSSGSAELSTSVNNYSKK